MSKFAILNHLMETVRDQRELAWFERTMQSNRPLSAYEQKRVRSIIRIGFAR